MTTKDTIPDAISTDARPGLADGRAFRRGIDDTSAVLLALLRHEGWTDAARWRDEVAMLLAAALRVHAEAPDRLQVQSFLRRGGDDFDVCFVVALDEEAVALDDARTARSIAVSPRLVPMLAALGLPEADFDPARVTTAAELRWLLERAGVVGVGADDVVRRTAGARHVHRVAATLSAAAVGYVRESSMSGASEPAMLLLLLLDCVGVGGRDGLDGDATLRMPWARVLGSGRKQAKDGNAWGNAAVDAALHALAGEVSVTPSGSVRAPATRAISVDLDEVRLVVWADTTDGDSRCGFVVADTEHRVDGVWTRQRRCRVNVQLAGRDVLPWVRTLAHEALRRCLNMGAVATLPPWAVVSGSAATWARLAEQAHARLAEVIAYGAGDEGDEQVDVTSAEAA